MLKRVGKRTFSALLAAVLIMGLVPTTAFASPVYSWPCGDGWFAKCTSDGTMYLSKAPGSTATDVVLGDFYYQHIPNYSEKIRPTVVTIPDGIVSLNLSGTRKNGGQFPSRAEVVSLPDSLQHLGDHSMSNQNLYTLELPSGLNYIGGYALSGSQNLTSLSIPSGVRHIGFWAFATSPNLKTVELPETVDHMGDGIFNGCTSLTSVTFPTNLTYIPAGTFEKCSSLTTFEIHQNITVIEDNAFADSGITSINFPEGLLCIDHHAFQNTALSVIELPDGLEAIGEEAFQGTNLTEVTIPQTVTYVGDRAFPAGKQFIVYGYRNTAAQWFAEGNGNTFIPLDDCGIDVEIKEENVVHGTVKAGTVTEIYWKGDEHDYRFGAVGDFSLYCTPELTLISDNDTFHDIVLTVRLPEGFSFEPDTLVTERDVPVNSTLSKDEELRVKLPSIYPVYLSDLDKTDIYTLQVKINATDSVNQQVQGSNRCGFFDPDEVNRTTEISGTYLSKVPYEFDLNSAAGSGSSYNQDTAKLATLLSDGAYVQESMEQFFLDLGFSNIYYRNLWNFNLNNCGYYIASKRIVEDNQIKLLIYVICRGTIMTLGEWMGNLNISTDDEHAGFGAAAETVQDTIQQYCERRGFSPNDTIFLVTGHSKGAAVANLVGNWLNNESGLAEKENISVYTLATPTVSTKLTAENSELEGNENIFNFVNYQDAIRNAPSMAHYGRYGHVYIFGFGDTPASTTLYNDGFNSYPALGLENENYTINELINGLLYDVNPATDLYEKGSWLQVLTNPESKLSTLGMFLLGKIDLSIKLFEALFGSMGYSGITGGELLDSLLKAHGLDTYMIAVSNNATHTPSFESVNAKTEQAISFYKERFPDNLLLLGLDMFLSNPILHLFACPVNIYVEDIEGNIVADSAGGQPISEDGQVIISVMGDMKFVAIAPGYEDQYTIRVEGYDEGTMTHVVFFADDEGVGQIKMLQSIPVHTGESHVVSPDGFVGEESEYITTTVEEDIAAICDGFNKLGEELLSSHETNDTLVWIDAPTEPESEPESDTEPTSETIPEPQPMPKPSESVPDPSDTLESEAVVTPEVPDVVEEEKDGGVAAFVVIGIFVVAVAGAFLFLKKKKLF